MCIRDSTNTSPHLSPRLSAPTLSCMRRLFARCRACSRAPPRCRDVDKAYQKLNKIDEGTYGVVYRARCRETSRIVALKQVPAQSTARAPGYPTSRAGCCCS
eukprot:1671219-Rhodomonas_salina.1